MAMMTLRYFILFFLKNIAPTEIMDFEILGVGTFIWIVFCLILGLIYPMYLLMHKQKEEAIITISSTVFGYLVLSRML